MRRRIVILLGMLMAWLSPIGFVVTIGEGACMLHAEEVKDPKARYYFMQGSVEASKKNMAEAYEYFKKAYELNPDYKDAAFNYGTQRLFLKTDTMQTATELHKSLQMAKEYVDAYPKDLYAAQMYGFLTTALDTVEESIRVYERTYALMPKETQLLQNLADAYMRILKGKDALNALNRFEAIEGKSHEVTLKKISILLSEKDTLGAIAEVNDLAAINPRDPYSRIMKGNIYEITGQMDSVLKAYKDAEALAPNNGAVKMSLAQYYRETGDSVMLDNMIYEALLSEDYELDDKLGILGDYLQKLLDDEGDKSRGDHLFSVLQSQYPHEPEVLDMSARYAGAKGNYQEAEEEIRYAIDLDPTNEKYWIMLLSFDMTQKEYPRAVEDYANAKEHLAPSLTLKNLYAASVSMLENTQEGEKMLIALIEETDPRLSTPEGRKELRDKLDYDNLMWVSNLYCMLGDIYYKQGNSERGFEEYEKSLYFVPDNVLTLNNYAYFLSEEGKDLEKAKKMSHLTLEVSEDNPTYYDTYAWILYKLGEYKEAMDYIQTAVDLANEQGDDNEEYQLHFEAIEKALNEENSK